MKKLMILAAGAVATIAVTSVAMADLKEDAITARRGYFQIMSFNAGPLFGMAKGQVEYDADAAKLYAANLQALADLDTTPMWVEGTDNEAMAGKTRALPAIWSTFPAINEKVQAYKDATAALNEAAGNGLDALRPAVANLGKSCGGCHETYRAKSF